MLIKHISTTFNRTEFLISAAYSKLVGDKKGMLGFLFHGIYSDKDEIEQDVILPHQRITVEDFRRIVTYFLEREYAFISPNDILDELNPDKNYVLLSFDDGYANNQLVLPILREYNIPGVFFISIDHTIANKSYWPDAVYREGIKRGENYREIIKKIEGLKSMKNYQIEEIVIEELGNGALTPINDIDRPFTPSELEEFSNDPLVFIGNHTCNHAILTNYSPAEIASELQSAQDKIYAITGQTPKAISFPNGNYSDIITRVSYDVGLKLGFTTIQKKNYLPLKYREGELTLVNRFFLAGNNLNAELKFSHGDIQIRTKIKSLFPRIIDLFD